MKVRTLTLWGFAVVCFTLGTTAGALFAGGDGGAEKPDYSWFEQGSHVHTMAWSAKQKKLYRNADPDLLSIWRVANPDDDEVVAENDYFRNALVVQVGDALVANHFALRYHWDWDPKTRTAFKRYNEGHSPAYVKRSTDHGRTWSEGVRLEETVGIGEIDAFYMTAVGTSGESIFIISRIDGDGGVYRSDDAGKTWRLVDADLKKSNPNVGSMSGIGPVMIDHPKAGLMIFGMKKIFREGQKKPDMDSAIRIANSTDGGKTWKKVTLDIEDPAVQPVEPTSLLLPNGQVLIYARNGPNHRSHYPAQVLIDVRGPGDYAVVYGKRANHMATKNPDTHGVIFNPKTKRVEALLSNRGGSKPFADDRGVSVSLWSMALKDVLAGSTVWRYHGLLNTMQGQYGDGDADRKRDWRYFQDGSHPGLGVVDVKRGKHLAFMHMGASSASFAGTYMIERSLDTDAVGEYLIENAAVDFGIRTGRHEAESFFNRGMTTSKRSGASGKGIARLVDGAEAGFVHHFFVGADGRYDITVGYAADAAATGEVLVNGKPIGKIAATSKTDPTQETFKNVAIRRGEEIRIAVSREGGATLGVDWIEIKAMASAIPGGTGN